MAGLKTAMDALKPWYTDLREGGHAACGGRNRRDFWCSHCDELIADGLPVYMGEDSPYCSESCRRSGCAPYGGDDSVVTLPVTMMPKSNGIKFRRSSSSRAQLCSMMQGSGSPLRPASAVDADAKHAYDIGQLAQVIDLETDSWVKCQIIGHCPYGKYSVKVLNSGLAASLGIVGMVGNGISPRHLRDLRIGSMAGCTPNVAFVGRAVMNVTASIMFAGFSVGAALAKFSLLGRVRSWMGAAHFENDVELLEESSADDKRSTTQTRGSVEADSSVAGLPAMAREAEAEAEAASSSDLEREAGAHKETFMRLASEACSEATTTASIPYSRHTSEDFAVMEMDPSMELMAS